MKQRSAVRHVLLLNWRGIAHTAVLLLSTNTVCPSLRKLTVQISIAWLVMLKQAASGSASRIVTWYQCVLQLGASSTRCEAFAEGIVDLKLIWFAELIMVLLGFTMFFIETSRKYDLLKLTNPRQWWLGWRDLFLDLYSKARAVELPRITRVQPMRTMSSGLITKSPNIKFLDLNRDLPKLPEMTSTSSAMTTRPIPEWSVVPGNLPKPGHVGYRI